MVIVATLALFFAALFAVCCVLLAAFIGSLLYMVILHHRLKDAGLRREEVLLATPLPADADLPHVVVQIPSFNEGAVVRRGAESAAALDWPRDKLHIQLLDDSTDETADMVRTVAAELRARGFDVVALQRTDRSGYKGGALHEAMQQTPYDFFAIFDVDYVPPVNFLRVCMRPFFAEPGTAFVQARFARGSSRRRAAGPAIRCPSTAPAASGNARPSTPAAVGRAIPSPRTSTSLIAAG